MAETRGLVGYYGGKARLADWINGQLPQGMRVYVEPFFGAGSVFFSRDRAPIEVINDADESLIAVYRVMQDAASLRQLLHRLRWTLYSRAELGRALRILNGGETDSVLRAWAMLVALVMGMSGKVRNEANFLCGLRRRLPRLARRLADVVVECRPAVKVLRQWDSRDTLAYLDPPYVRGTRRRKDAYRREMSDDEHRELVAAALQCSGAVAISGYANAIYEPLEAAGWQVTRRRVHASSAARVRVRGLIGAPQAFRPRLGLSRGADNLPSRPATQAPPTTILSRVSVAGPAGLYIRRAENSRAREDANRAPRGTRGAWRWRSSER